MKKLNEFQNESLELNKVLNVKGGDRGVGTSTPVGPPPIKIQATLLGGDNTGCTDSVVTNPQATNYDMVYHRYNDDNSYNGYETKN